MNIFERLREDHDHQRHIMDSLVATSGDTKTREKLFAELKQNMAAHADAEERYFYVPLIEIDLTQEKARHSIAEHHEMDEFIEELEATDMSSSAWLTICKDLQHRLFHHLDEEEKEIFPVAGKVLTETQKSDLGQDYGVHMKKHS